MEGPLFEMIATSEAERRRPGVCTHLPKTDVKNKSEKSGGERATRRRCSSANSLQSAANRRANSCT